MRTFHWLAVVAFAAALATAESERFRDTHVALGYGFIGLLAFRLVWGVVGTHHARFASFACGPKAVAAYLRSLWSRRPQHYFGHSPAGSVAIFALIALGLATGATGYAVHEHFGGHWLEELHEGVANALLALVAIHVTGVIVASVLHRENLVAAMFTGCKRRDTGGSSHSRGEVRGHDH